jgi:hypothetical protein
MWQMLREHSCTWRFKSSGILLCVDYKLGRVQLKCDGTRWGMGGEVKGKLANGLGSQYSYPTSEHGASSITTADPYTSAASSRLNWAPRQFKWIRLFRRRKKSGFCTCAITFQMHSTYALKEHNAKIFRVSRYRKTTCWTVWPHRSRHYAPPECWYLPVDIAWHPRGLVASVIVWEPGILQFYVFNQWHINTKYIIFCLFCFVFWVTF